MILRFPGGDSEIPEATKDQLQESACSWLGYAQDALKRGADAEFHRCMSYFERYRSEANVMAR